MNIKYSTPQDIVDTMDKDEMKSNLKELDIKFHPAEGAKKLSEKLFRAYNGMGQDEPIPVIKPQTTKEFLMDEIASDDSDEDEGAIDAKRIEEAAKKIRFESTKVKKGRRQKSKTYISKKFNHWLATRGKDKSGVEIRYVKGQKSILPDEQSGIKAFKVDNIRFRGVENYEYKMGDFTGRSIVIVSDPVMMKYIESHEQFGRQIVEYDEEELNRQSLVNEKMETNLKFWAFNAENDDLIAVLVFIENRMGKNTYDKWSSTIDNSKIINTILKYIKHDPEEFLKVMEDQTPKMYHLVHKAKDVGIISVSRNGRDIKMTENNNIICHSSISSDWEYDLITHLLSPKGASLLYRFQRDLDYHVV